MKRSQRFTNAGLGILTVLAVLGSRPAIAEDGTIFVPVVLAVDGIGGSHFTSEMTLSNHGTTSAMLTLRYTATAGGGTGSTTILLSHGAQLVILDVIDFLKSRGLGIAASGARLGTLSLDFTGASPADAVAATVRTTTPVPPGAPIGRAGLAYAGVPKTSLLTGPALLGALRVNASDRTNVAIQNPTAGQVTVKISYFEGSQPSTVPVAVRQETLAGGEFRQLALTDIAPGAVEGWIRLELVSGGGAYGYAVVNDNVNSDGSFVAPVLEATLAGRRGLTLPVVVETGVFTTELAITNTTSAPKTVHLVYSASALETGDHTVSTDVALAAGEQRIVDGFVQTLRNANPAAVPSGRTYTGPLLASVAGGDMTGVLLGARVLNPGGGGRYGLFFQALPTGLAVPYSSSAAEAWLYGLRQDSENRTNVAFVNTGETDDSAVVLRVEVFDGASGAKVADVTLPSLAARSFTQVNAALGAWAPGTPQAFARVTRISGTNPFLSYAVVNDGAAPGLRSGDGAFVSMATNLQTDEKFSGSWHNTTFGSTGPMSMDLAVDWLRQSFVATITLGGSVFGLPSPPPPFAFSGTFREVGTTTTTQSSPLGTCAVTSQTAGAGFSFSSTCTAVPGGTGITEFDFAGSFDGNAWNGTYAVHIGSFVAGGTYAMTRQ
jgi:hypothetical protein